MGGSGVRTGLPARCSASPSTVPTPASPPSSHDPRRFPFCFDWTADDELLVTGRRGLERLGPDGRLVPHTDLSQLSEYGWNEIAVHPSGAAYVNGINFDMMGADGMNFELGSKRGLIAVVTPDGGTRIVADTVAFPNGMAITPDGATLLVAESFASRVAAFDVADDHSLTNRRVWAEIDGGADGVSLDADGALWCAAQGGATRLAQGGQILQRIELDRPAFSVALGGPERDDAVHGRQRMERPREHRQGSSHRGHLHDRGRGPRSQPPKPRLTVPPATERQHRMTGAALTRTFQ